MFTDLTDEKPTRVDGDVVETLEQLTELVADARAEERSRSEESEHSLRLIIASATGSSAASSCVASPTVRKPEEEPEKQLIEADSTEGAETVAEAKKFDRLGSLEIHEESVEKRENGAGAEEVKEDGVQSQEVQAIHEPKTQPRLNGMETNSIASECSGISVVSNSSTSAASGASAAGTISSSTFVTATTVPVVIMSSVAKNSLLGQNGAQQPPTKLMKVDVHDGLTRLHPIAPRPAPTTAIKKSNMSDSAQKSSAQTATSTGTAASTTPARPLQSVAPATIKMVQQNVGGTATTARRTSTPGVATPMVFTTAATPLLAKKLNTNDAKEAATPNVAATNVPATKVMAGQKQQRPKQSVPAVGKTLSAASRVADTVEKVAAGESTIPASSTATVTQPPEEPKPGQQNLAKPRPPKKKTSGAKQPNGGAMEGDRPKPVQQQNLQHQVQASGFMRFGWPPPQQIPVGSGVFPANFVSASSTGGGAQVLLPQLTMAAPSGAIVAVSNGGLTQYYIKQATPQQLIPMVSSQQHFYFSPGANPTQAQMEGAVETAAQGPPEDSAGQPARNMIFRAGNELFMHQPIAVQQKQQQMPALTASTQQQQHQVKCVLRPPILSKGQKQQQEAEPAQQSSSGAAAFPGPTTLVRIQQLAPMTGELQQQMYVAPSNGTVPSVQQHQRAAAHFGQFDGLPQIAPRPSPQKRRRKADEDFAAPPPLAAAHSQTEVDEEENEPPPVLCRDEPTVLSSGHTATMESAFQLEAKLIRERLFDAGGRRLPPLRHFIDGFEIEEDVEPFPVEHRPLLDKLRAEQQLGGKQSESASSSTSPAGKPGEGKKDSTRPSHGGRKRLASSSHSSSSSCAQSPKRSSAVPTPSKSTAPKEGEKPIKKGTGGGRRRELESLLKMDFGKHTPFQTKDPDKYAQEVLIEARQQQRTLALAMAREARHSVESSSSAGGGTKASKRDKHAKKPFSPQTSPPSVQNQSAGSQLIVKLSPKTPPKEGEKRPSGASDGSSEERCLHCRRSFAEVPKDKHHVQYCSKECRRALKHARRERRQQQPSSSFDIGEAMGEEAAANMSTTSSTSRDVVVSPSAARKSEQQMANGESPQQPHITSPLGSAFSAMQPQALSKQRRVDAQAEQLMQQQQRMTTAGFATPFGASPPGGEQQQILAFPTAMRHPAQMVAGMPLQYSGSAAMYFAATPEQQQQILQQQMLQQQFAAAQQASSHSPAHFLVPSQFAAAQLAQQTTSGTPTMPVATTPLGAAASATFGGGGERNAEIEALIGLGVPNWTKDDVAHWVNHVTNSETNGDRFVEEEIDGSSLLCFSQEQFQRGLGLKMGPAVKLSSALELLKRTLS